MKNSKIKLLIVVGVTILSIVGTLSKDFIEAKRIVRYLEPEFDLSFAHSFR